jgi:hypothetical protein
VTLEQHDYGINSMRGSGNLIRGVVIEFESLRHAIVTF